MALEDLLGGLTESLKSTGLSALAAATGFDAAAGRFRNAAGQFQQAGSLMSGSMMGAANKIGTAGREAAGAIKDLGGVVKTLASADLPSAKQAMGMLGATLGGAVTSGADKAAEALSKLGPEGEAAGIALQGLAAAFAATIGLMTTFMGLAIESAQKADLMRDRFAVLVGSAAVGKAVQASLGKLNLPFAPAQVNEWAQALLGAGVKGKQLEADVKAIAAATALMGEQGGAAAQTLFKRLGEGGPAADTLLKAFKDGGPKADKLLKEMGLSIADLGGQAALAKMNTEQLHAALAKAMEKKGKGPLEDMGLSLQVILGKARGGFLSLFGGVEGPVKAFMTAVKDLFGQFNKGSPIIKALKPIMTGLLTTLFTWATKATVAVKDFVVWLSKSGKEGGIFSGVISVLKSGWKALVAIFGTMKTALAPVLSLLKAVFTNALVLKGIKTIFTVIVAVVVALVVAFAALVAAVATVQAAVAAVFGAIAGTVMGAIGGIVDALSSFDFSAFIAKMGDMAKAGLAAFKGVFGIASPSRVLLEHGEEDMAGAAAQGVDKGAGKLKSSMKRMGDEATPGKGKGGARSGDDGAGASFTFNDCNFGGTDESTIRRMMTQAWAAMAAQAGAVKT